MRSLCPDVKTGVLLLHGLTGMPSEMRPVAKHLTQMGCIVECPLVPGHGGSHDELLKTGWKDWYQGAREALDSLARKCDHVVIGGLSMGALLAALSSIDEPKVSGLVMLSTTLRYDGRTANPFHRLLWLV
ncbi:MAG: alpha/beta hydrolase, partial [Terriglobales bacterium]